MQKHERDGARQRIRILIADDHPIYRDGLRHLIDHEPGFELAGEAADGAQAVDLVTKTKPDLMLLDLVMPKLTGLEVLRKIPRTNSAMKTIILTASIEQQQITEALRLGARGVVLKNVATDFLVKSIRCVAEGQYWVGRNNVSDLVQALQMANTPSDGAETYHLTAREREVITAIVEGYTNKEIARRFSITERTVKHHLSNCFDKCGVSNRLELALFSVNHSLSDGK